MAVIKHARSYEDAIKKINRATKRTVKQFKKQGKHIKRDSPAGRRINKKLKEYWENNIYDTFNARGRSRCSGQLGKSLVVQFRKEEIRWYMKRISHPEGGGISGGECYDYGRLLRQEKTNFPQRPNDGSKQPSKYSPLYDAKIRSKDGQRTLSRKKYWEKWEIVWLKYFDKTCDEEIARMLGDIIKEELERSL